MFNDRYKLIGISVNPAKEGYLQSRYSELLEEFGVTKCNIWLILNVIFLPLKYYSLKHLWEFIGVEKITKKQL